MSQKTKGPNLGHSPHPWTTAAEHRDSQKQIRLPRPPRIVVVDDEPGVPAMIEIIMRVWFSALTFLPFTASTEAWEELSQRDPDLLITDDLMPCMCGHEMCERLLDRKATYPIIVRSGLVGSQNWIQKLAGKGLNVRYLAIPHAGELGMLRTLVEESLRKHLTEGNRAAHVVPKRNHARSPSILRPVSANPASVGDLPIILQSPFSRSAKKPG